MAFCTRGCSDSRRLPASTSWVCRTRTAGLRSMRLLPNGRWSCQGMAFECLRLAPQTLILNFLCSSTFGVRQLTGVVGQEGEWPRSRLQGYEGAAHWRSVAMTVALIDVAGRGAAAQGGTRESNGHSATAVRLTYLGTAAAKCPMAALWSSSIPTSHGCPGRRSEAGSRHATVFRSPCSGIGPSRRTRPRSTHACSARITCSWGTWPATTCWTCRTSRAAPAPASSGRRAPATSPPRTGSPTRSSSRCTAGRITISAVSRCA